jgi:hypothetical protein
VLIADAIKRTDCSARIKTVLYSLLKEYKTNGKLRIWDESKFADQATLIADFLNLADAVHNAQRSSCDSMSFTCRLNTLIAKKLYTITDDILLTVSHYLVKAFSETGQEGIEFYRNWVKAITERGKRV